MKPIDFLKKVDPENAKHFVYFALAHYSKHLLTQEKVSPVVERFKLKELAQQFNEWDQANLEEVRAQIGVSQNDGGDNQEKEVNQEQALLDAEERSRGSLTQQEYEELRGDEEDY